MDFAFRPTPPADALAYFAQKGWAVSFDHRDVWREEHVRAFTVAKAMSLEVLGTIRGATLDALNAGRTLRAFTRELTPELQRLGWWGRQEMTDPLTRERRLVQLGSPRRLETIYRVNLRVARAAGQWARIQRRKEGLPYLLYRLGPSAEHRPEHQAWDGTILPVDDPWWRTHYPPNGWGCKCRVRQITAREAERLGGVSRRPRLQRRPYRNTRTGETTQVPRGIDPGWDYNPGAVRVPPLPPGTQQPLPGQPTARSLGRPRLTPRGSAPPQLPKATSPDEAREIIDRALGLSEAAPQRVVETPVWPVILSRERTEHIIRDAEGDRERWANLIVPTLNDPDEVWLTQYPTGSRLHYIRAWEGRRNGFVVVEEDPHHQVIFTTFMQRSRVESRRVGWVVYPQE